ncbi:MAG: hypothetical protein ACT4P9_07510 [Betaproteobacteria bacterium]
MKRLALAALVLWLPLAAPAQEPIESVYAKLHAAALAANSDAALAYATAPRKAELAGMPKAEKDAFFKMMSGLMPRTYTVTGKRVAPGGKSAVLRATGTGEFMGRQQMYAEVKFQMEGNAWKVDTWEWTGTPPAGPMAAPPPAAPAVSPSRPQAKAPSRPVQAPAASPPAKLGQQSDSQCVYKPVMTEEDMEKCRAPRR